MKDLQSRSMILLVVLKVATKLLAGPELCKPQIKFSLAFPIEFGSKRVKVFMQSSSLTFWVFCYKCCNEFHFWSVFSHYTAEALAHLGLSNKKIVRVSIFKVNDQINSVVETNFCLILALLINIPLWTTRSLGYVSNVSKITKPLRTKK